MGGGLSFLFPTSIPWHTFSYSSHALWTGGGEKGRGDIGKYGQGEKRVLFFLLLQEETADDRQVVVRNASLMTSGEFRCQVSGEGPLFATVTTSKMLRVAGKLVFFYFRLLCYAMLLYFFIFINSGP